MSPLRKEFEYYLANKDSLIAEHRGRVIVVMNEQVLGDFATEREALTFMEGKADLGTFLVQRCDPGAEAQTFHSRVAFA